jgi:twitching motility two-component system response regulator PilH
MIRTIYLAHDQQESPEHRKHLLELSGYVVRTFPDHATLLETLRQRTPSLLLMDTLLEGRNGFDTTREIHAEFPDREFPIVLCTSVYRSRAFREEALRCGAQDYFLLPMAPDEFLRRVSQAIAYFVPPDEASTAA